VHIREDLVDRTGLGLEQELEDEAVISRAAATG